jgi:hypothetical protein
MSTSRKSTPLYESVRSLVLLARQSAARGVNLLQVCTNYEIGRRIFEQEQQGADAEGSPLPSAFARNTVGLSVGRGA